MMGESLAGRKLKVRKSRGTKESDILAEKKVDQIGKEEESKSLSRK